MGCPLTSRSSSIYKASCPYLSDKATGRINPFILLMRTSPRQASAHRNLHCHDSQRWQRSPSHGHHDESCRAHLQAPHDPTAMNIKPLFLVHSPLPKSIPMELLA
ncbi:hypothetical protein TNCV_875381 [Trichonephila clavipes]|nr:hypothetical protein TNCV_875381 [Trichonephila clavipes]